MHDDQEPRWLPLAEAARELGISTDTARRRLRKGMLHGEQRATPQGFTWWVCLSDPATSAAPPRQPAQPGIVELVALVDRLQRENRDLAGLVGQLQERNATLEAQLALPTPSEIAPQRTPDDAALETTQKTSDARPGRPWWQFWTQRPA